MKLSSIISRFYVNIRRAYGIDARSLALFRIAVGLVVLIDLIRRLQHSTAMYSDAGVLPRVDAIPVLNPFRWSLLFANGSPEFASAILIAGILAAVAMILGWRTRTVIILLWVIIVSLQIRNQHLNNGGDTLIRASLFWGMFLPLGSKWSMDNHLRGSSNESYVDDRPLGSVTSLATFAIILQIACVYLFTAILKEGPRWRDDGNALYLALGARDLSTGFGDWVFHSAPTTFLSFLTYGTLLLEYAVPIMLLLPVRSGFLRTMGLLLVVGLQVGILTTMTVGLFPAISIATALGIMPTWFWERVVARVPMPFGITAVQRRMQLFPLPVISLPSIPKSTLFIADPDRRHAAGEQDRTAVHFVFNPEVLRPNPGSVLNNLVIVIAIVAMLGWNIQSVSGHRLPDPVRNTAVALGFNQKWSMFAPNPPSISSWYLVEGELEVGERVDLLRPTFEGDVSLRAPVVWDQSGQVANQDKYWRKYFSSIRTRETPKLRFASYVCRIWNVNNTGEDRLVRLTLYRGIAETLPESERSDPNFIELGSWSCR